MRLLHTMLRVKNLEESTKFYTEKFGMQVVRALDDGAGKRIAFVGYGDEKRHTLLELQYAPDKVETIRSEFFGHIAIEVDDVHAAFEQLCKQGAQPLKAPKLMDDDEIIASVQDPNGYKIELIQFLVGS